MIPPSLPATVEVDPISYIVREREGQPEAETGFLSLPYVTAEPSHDGGVTISAPGADTSLYASTITVDGFMDRDLARKQKLALDELERYSTYKSGWDGYDGEQFEHTVLDMAKRIVRMGYTLLSGCGAELAEITPGPASDGSVDVEFVASTRRVIFTIYPPAIELEVHAESDHVHEEEVVPAGSVGRMEEWLAWVGQSSSLQATLR